MLTRSRIISDASGICGNPPTTPMPDGIPEADRFIWAADLETELVRDLNLSPEDHLVSSTPIQLQVQNQDFLLTGNGVESPCYVSVEIPDAPTWWPNSRDVEITNLAQINTNIWERRLAVAFYDQNPIHGRVSWLPLGTEVLTVWFDYSPQTDPSADQAQFTITAGYLPLLKLMLAAQMMEAMGKPIGTMLMSRIDRGLKQWEKYVKRNRQPGIIQKPSFDGGPWRRQRGAGVWNSEFPIR